MSYRIFESGPLTATGNLVVLNVSTESGVTLWVDDNGNGSTITVETSPDNSAWSAYTAGVTVTPTGSAPIGGSTFTAKGVFFFPVVGINYIRFRVSTYVSGTVRVRWEDTVSAFGPTSGHIMTFMEPTSILLTGKYANSQIIHPSSETGPATYTIPSRAQHDFPIGTAITFLNQNGAGNVTIAINSDTLRQPGTANTGSRTLAPNSTATVVKIDDTEWQIVSGGGMS